MTDYPRCLEPDFTPFDPLELARLTEEIVCEGDRRKYTKFFCPRVYGGIATGFTCGCFLKCVFCWVDKSRDFPERHGRFYSPGEAYRQMSRVAQKKGVDQLRVSGAEPTLGKEHLLGLLELVDRSSYRLFILETNGMLLGADPGYAREIARFGKVHTRVSIKAGTAEAFTRKTGALPDFFELPFHGIENLLENGASFHVATMTDDLRIVTPKERESLLDRLASIHPALVRHLEEESIVPYPNAVERLRKAGHHWKGD